MIKIRSAILISRNDIDNFVNRKILEKHGVNKIIIFENSVQALLYLQKTKLHFHLVLVDTHMPVIDGFEFIEKLQNLQIHKNQGRICILSASINPMDIEKAKERNTLFISKPLTLDKIQEIELNLI